MSSFVIESFAAPSYYRGTGQLDPSSGPAEVAFVGQSPASSLAAPIGTSFIEGTGESAPSDLPSWIGLAALAGIALVIFTGRKRWK